MEKEWEKFGDIVTGCTNDACGMGLVSGQRRKESEWWNEEVGRVMAENRRAFEEWLQRRDRVTYDRYRPQRVVVKRAVKLQNDGGLEMGSAIGELFLGQQKDVLERGKASEEI